MAERYLDDGDMVLYAGDAGEVMAELEPASFDAVVTSPPYADLRSYGGSKPEDYGEWIAPFLAAALPLVKPSGSMMLNVGRVLRDGCEVPIAEAARDAAITAGWLWLDSMVWNKPNAFYSASAPYLHNVHEHVWWLARSTDAYRGYDAETRTPHSPTTIERYSQGFRTNRSKDGTRYHKKGKSIARPNPDGACPKSVVTFSIAGHRGIKHPAPMAIKLARHLVALACPAGGSVLDPFVGSGTTCLAARELGRSSVGIDLNTDYLDEACSRTRILALGGV